MNAYLKIARSTKNSSKIRIQITKNIVKAPRKAVTTKGKQLGKTSAPRSSSPSIYSFPPSSPRNTTEFLIERSEHRDVLLEQLAGMVELGLTNAYGSMADLMNRDITSACRMEKAVESYGLISPAAH